MRFEPSNAKFFSVEVNWESMTTVLRLTGAFTQTSELSEDNEEEINVKPLLVQCHQVFRMDENIHMGYSRLSFYIPHIYIKNCTKWNASYCILRVLSHKTSLQYGIR